MFIIKRIIKAIDDLQINFKFPNRREDGMICENAELLFKTKKQNQAGFFLNKEYHTKRYP